MIANWKIATAGFAVIVAIAPAQAFQRGLPPGVTRMSMDERMTQCHAMMPGVMQHMREMERARGGRSASPGPRDGEAHEMSIVALRECRALMTDMLAHLVQMERAARRRR